MSLGNLELIVEINQAKANSTATKAANAMGSVMQNALKKVFDGVFDPLTTGGKNSSESVKSSLASILPIAKSIKVELQEVFKSRDLKVTFDSRQLQSNFAQLQRDKEALAKPVDIQIRAEISKAKADIESLIKVLNAVGKTEDIVVVVNTDRALREIATLQKALDKVSKLPDINVKANANKAIESVALLNKDLDRIAKREEVELKLTAEKARQDVETLNRELDRAARKDELELKIQTEKALAEIATVQKNLDRVAAKEAIQLKLESDKALKEIDNVQRELDRAASKENIQLTLEANQALKELDILQRDLDRLANSENIQLKIEADKALKEIDTIQRELDRVANREVVELKIDADRALKEVDNVQRELDRAASKEVIQLKVESDKAIKELDNVQRDLDRIAAHEDIQLKLAAEQAIKEIDVVQKGLDRIANKELVQLKLDSDKALKELDNLQRELDRIDSREQFELKLEADRAIKELDNVQRDLDRIARHDDIELKVSADRALKELDGVQKELDRVARREEVKLTLEANQAIREIESVDRELDRVANKEAIQLNIDATKAIKELDNVQRELDRVAKREDLQLKLESDRAIKEIDNVQREIDRIAAHDNIQLKISADKALKELDNVQRELDRVAKREEVEIKVKADKALKILDVVQKGFNRLVDHGETQLKLSNEKAITKIESTDKKLDRLARKEDIQLKINADKALKDLDIAQKQLDRLSVKENLEIKINADRALKELDIVQKELDRVAAREAVELKISSENARKAIDVWQKDLDRVAAKENIELKINADKAKQELDLVNKDLDRLAAKENIELKLTADKVKQELDLLSRDLDRLAARENLELKLSADKAKQELDLINKDLDRLAARENLELKIEADKAKQELDLLSRDLDRLAARENLDVKIEADKAKQDLDLINKEFDRIAARDNLEFKIQADKAKQELDLLSKELDRLANRENLELKLEADRAKQELDLVSRELDRLATKENLELKLDADRAKQDLDLLSRELDRLQSQVNLELKLNADRAIQELKSIDKELDRIAARQNLELKLESDRAIQELKSIDKELDRIAARENIELRINAQRADQESKELKKNLDQIDKDIQAKINLEAKQALADAKALQAIRDALEKDRILQLELDAKQAEQELKNIRQEVKDTASTFDNLKIGKLEAQVNLGGSNVGELEKELALVRELQRYKSELAKVESMKLSTDNLERAKKELLEIHNLANQAIDVRFSPPKGLDRIKAEFKEVTSSIRSNLDSISQGVLQGIGQRITQGFVDSVRGSAAAVGDAVTTFSTFEDKINQFGTFSNATAGEINKLRDEAKQLGLDTSKTATGSAEAAIQMVKLGFSASEAKQQLKGVVALSESTGLEDMGKAAEIAGAAYSVFGIEAGRTADIVSATANNSAANAEDMLQVLSKTGGVAKATGQSIETLSTAFGLLRNAGFTAESGATGLKTAMLRLSAPSNEGKKALETLGVSAYDANGKMKPLLSLLPEFKQALSGFDDASKADLTRRIFGDRGGPTFLALMNQSKEVVDELFNKISKSDGTAESSAKKLLVGLPGAMKLVKNSIETIKINFGEALSPALEAILRAASTIMNTLAKGDMFAKLNAGAKAFADYLNNTPEVVTVLVQSIGELVAMMGEKLGTAAKDFAQYLTANPEAMKTMVEDAVNLAVNIGNATVAIFEFGKGFAEASLFLSSMIEPLISFTANITGSKDGSASLAENLGKAAAFMLPLLAISNVLSIVTSIGSALTGVVGLVGGWASVTATISTVATGIATTLLTTFSVMTGLVTGAISLGGAISAVAGTLNPIGVVVAAISITIYNIVTYTQNWGDVVLGVKQTIIDTKNVFKDVVRVIVEAIGQSKNFEKIWTVIKDLIVYLLNPFAGTVKLIDQGIQKTGIFKNEWNAIKGLAQGVADTFKNVVGGTLSGLIDKAKELFAWIKSMSGMGGGASGSGGSAGSLNISGLNETQKQSAALITNVGKSAGLNENQIAAMIAGAMQESQLGTAVDEVGGYGGKGLFQLTDAEGQSGTWIGKGGIKSTQDYYDPEKNVKAIMEDGAFQDWKERSKNQSAEEAATSFAKMVLRPYEVGDKYAGRARDLFPGGNTSIVNSATGTGIAGGVASIANSVSSFGGGTGKAQLPGSNSGGLDASGQNGADMPVGPNNEIFSYHNGIVSELGTAGNNGNYVVVEYLDDLGNKLEATYSHIGAIVKKGQAVIGGQILGHFDASGRTFGAHNSIDINTPGTNGALQRSQEGAAARRGADILVTGKVQGVGSSGFSGSQSNFGLQEPNLSSIKGMGGYDVDGEDSGLRSLVKEEEAKKAEDEKKKQEAKIKKEQEKAQKAIELSRKMQDSATQQQRKRDKEQKEQARQEELLTIDKQLASITNPDARSSLEARKKEITLTASETAKIDEAELSKADLIKARDRKVQDLKSPLEDVREKAKQEPDYTKAIGDLNAYIATQQKLKDEVLGISKIEIDTAEKSKNKVQDRANAATTLQQAYEKEKQALEEKRDLELITNPDAAKTTDFQLQRLQIQYDMNKAMAEAVAKQEDLNEEIAKLGKDNKALPRLQDQLKNIEAEIVSIQSKADSGLVRISIKEMQDLTEMANRMKELNLKKDDTLATSSISVKKTQADVMRAKGDEFGANALDREAAIDEQKLKNKQRLLAVEKDIEDMQAKGNPYSAEQIAQLRAEAQQLNKINLTNAGEQFKTLGQVIKDTAKNALGGFFKDILTGSKSVGEAFKSMIDNILAKVADLAVNSLLQDLFGNATKKGIFGGGGKKESGTGGGLGGIIGGIASSIFGGGFSQGGLVPNYANGNLTTIGQNRPYLAGSEFKGENAITKALKREGTGGVVSVLKANELVLTPEQTRTFFAKGLDQQLTTNVRNYSEGNLNELRSSGGNGAATNGSMTVTVPININMGANKEQPKINVPELQEEVNKAVLANLQKQRRNGGLVTS